MIIGPPFVAACLMRYVAASSWVPAIDTLFAKDDSFRPRYQVAATLFHKVMDPMRPKVTGLSPNSPGDGVETKTSVDSTLGRD
jgi:hypothetical protein